MKFFKNFKTKRQLKEEIARLEGMLSVPRYSEKVDTNKGEVVAVAIQRAIDYDFVHIPLYVIKNEMCKEIAHELESVIEWETRDRMEFNDKVLRGTLYVVKRR